MVKAKQRKRRERLEEKELKAMHRKQQKRRELAILKEAESKQVFNEVSNFRKPLMVSVGDAFLNAFRTR